MTGKISAKGRYPKRYQERDKPGGKIIRGSGRGGISRPNTSSIRYIVPSRIREAFLDSPTLQLTKITVSNLDYGITDSDLYELFSRFGPVESAKVQCDKLGQSLGSAYVVFERRSDAIEAIKHCNGVPLEGRDMKIEFSRQLKNPSLSVNTVKFVYQRKNKRKCNRRYRKALRTDNDEVNAQLEESLKSQLVISDNV